MVRARRRSHRSGFRATTRRKRACPSNETGHQPQRAQSPRKTAATLSLELEKLIGPNRRSDRATSVDSSKSSGSNGGCVISHCSTLLSARQAVRLRFCCARVDDVAPKRLHPRPNDDLPTKCWSNVPSCYGDGWSFGSCRFSDSRRATSKSPYHQVSLTACRPQAACRARTPRPPSAGARHAGARGCALRFRRTPP
jgi:hypothetical protein